MADPLDYRNPRAADGRERIGPVTPAPRAVIPVEFDTLLTRTEDHAAVRAIENELGRAGIELFRSESGDPAKRSVELHVRAADFERAGPIAAEVFVRRKKIKSIPRPKPVEETTFSARGPYWGPLGF
jgi:hypothetical protein